MENYVLPAGEMPRVSMVQYMRAAHLFDNHDGAHLFNAYIAGFTSETLEFLHEARKLANANALVDFDTEAFALESGDMLWNMAMLMQWWGYDFDSPEYGDTGAYRAAQTMSMRDLIELIQANVMVMNGRVEKSYRHGSTQADTNDMKIQLQHVYHAWVVLNFRAGYTPEDIANLNVRKLCHVYKRDEWRMRIDVTAE